MEENSAYLMLHEKLEANFNEQQWLIISAEGSKQFLSIQTEIMNKLLSNRKMFQKYFYNFYRNHQIILDWHTLALQNKLQIAQYLFTNLIKKKINFYNEKLKEVYKNQEIKKIKIRKQYQQNNYKKTVQSQNNLHQIFPVYSLQNILVDNHNFYLKTFEACNGRQYCFYNHQKHMKGLKQKAKHNNFIKKNHRKTVACESSPHKLEHYCQFQQQRSRCAFLPVNAVLKQNNLNTWKNLQETIHYKKKQQSSFSKSSRKTNHLSYSQITNQKYNQTKNMKSQQKSQFIIIMFLFKDLSYY